MRIYFLLLGLLIPMCMWSQLKGKVTDEQGTPLTYVSIYIENTYIGTTTNDQGNFELNIGGENPVQVIFQYLGFKTQKRLIDPKNKPAFLEIQLIEENYTLKEVVLSSGENPAHPIIRNAIAKRKINGDKAGRFSADFYSKGLFKLKNVPKKILGQEVGDFGGNLDSTGTGIIYLSETISKISFEKPDNLKEKIVASKISGNDNGYSYNTARATVFDIYDNTLDFGGKVISPIADNAFGYYKYELEGFFYDEHNHLINKIKVTPKRDLEPAFEGFIYIVEDQWTIYGAELTIKGYRIKEEFLNSMTLRQTFSFNPNTKIWAKNIQSLDIEAGAFGIVFQGKFTYVYSNYEFKTAFDRNTFGREILSFELEANKKDTLFWNTIRPVPLTLEETVDYRKKDSVQTLRKSKTYMDSVDRVKNKFKWNSILNGYTYRNSHEGWNINYEGILKLAHFNTVQGWNLSSGISYTKRNEEKRTFYRFGSNFQYGFADERFRATGYFNTRLSRINNSFLSISGGNQVAQFNPANPISPFINSMSTLFFKDNYMKLYEKNFVRGAYQQELINGIYMWSSLEYGDRKPLFNNTNYTMIKRDKEYTSNNPLNPEEDIAAFDRHQLVKANVQFRFNFGQKYFSRPDGKFNIRNDKYPSLFAGYEKGFAGSDSSYEYDFIFGRLLYEQTLGNKGDFAVNFKAGKFFNADGIAFVDYKHFNGNQTHINNGDRYLNVFNFLPYYSRSTNDSYTEIHAEHNFQGYVMNKIPLLKHLKSTLVLGYHQLGVPGEKPYQEFTVGLDKLGFGKFRIFRIDYLRSYNGSGFAGDGIIFGIKLLDVAN